MVINDPTDNAYAQACQKVLEDETLSLEEIESKLYTAGTKYFPGHSQPKNLMLAAVHTAVEFDELNPRFEYSGEILERIRSFVADYLQGNFHPTYWALSIYYRFESQGYTLKITAYGNKYRVTCAHPELLTALEKVVKDQKASGNEEADLIALQRQLPQKVGILDLEYTELEEYFVN